ncbi:MAG TPA: HEAT repeat domain-containing protein [Thermoanaerobaculia bacterium]|nr:HEAT repeat domain-containing protein [Thermoanaerobaculia bacterium]
MPLLLTESLDANRRELTHQHIESCGLCSAEWEAYRETWAIMGDLPEVAVPAQVKEAFLQKAGIAPKQADNVVPFRRPPAFKWIAQAAAVVILAGGSYFLGDRNADRIQTMPATLNNVTASPFNTVSHQEPMSIAETRVLDADAISPEFEGRPNISNVQIIDGDASDDKVVISFDISSKWTVTGSPNDKSIVRLSSYMIENEETVTPRANAIEWVRRTYSDPANANPEIATAWARQLNNDSHEGARIRAVENLTNLPPAVATPTRDALITALQNDPNPAVRMKAVEALANLVRSGAVLDKTTVDTLRRKAMQQDENQYVRVKAAEALSNIKP